MKLADGLNLTDDMIAMLQVNGWIPLEAHTLGCSCQNHIPRHQCRRLTQKGNLSCNMQMQGKLLCLGFLMPTPPPSSPLPNPMQDTFAHTYYVTREVSRLTKRGTLKIISEVEESCMSLPFNLVLIRSWLGSLIRSLETRHGPRGANVSNDLLKHHCPDPKLLPCNLRVLMSFPTVYPTIQLP